MKAKKRVNPDKFMIYLKMVMLAILVMTEIAVCVQFAARFIGTEGARDVTVVAACCVALTVLVSLDNFAVRKSGVRMFFFTVETGILLVICIYTGNSLLSTLYCVILTQLYMNMDKLTDKLAIFGISCAMYAISFTVGWVLTHAGATVFNSTVEIMSGVVFGLLVIAADFLVVQFLLRFYRTNRKLSIALKEADDSRERLEETYKQLSETAVFEERNRIAKDIHDNAGHLMTTVIMQTEAAKLLIDTDPQEAKTRIISANLQAKNALEQMRESVHLLAGRAGAKTLREELLDIIAQTIDGTDVKIRYDLQEIDAGDEKRRFLCNTLKECLSNGIRHGSATAFFVELCTEDGNIRLFVSDNGKGAEGEIKMGFGLNGICNKAAEFGGEVRTHSEKGEGFEVVLTLPRKKDKEDKK